MANSSGSDKLDLANAHLNEQEMQNIRVGYQVAAGLIFDEGATHWAKFNAMLLANSIIFASLALLLNADEIIYRLVIALGFVGAIFSAIWFAIMVRGLDYYQYWMFNAREMEANFLKPITTLQRGGDFADGGEVFFDFGDSKKCHKISWWGGLRVKEGSIIMILLFMILYLLMLVSLLTPWNILGIRGN